MTDRKRVFCKDCRWFKHKNKKIKNNRRVRLIQCMFNAKYDPVWGTTEHPKIISPFIKNINLNCPDYELKETDDD